jgi:hypothetical protein
LQAVEKIGFEHLRAAAIVPGGDGCDLYVNFLRPKKGKQDIFFPSTRPSCK